MFKTKTASIIVSTLVLAIVFSIGFISGRANPAEASFASSQKIPDFILEGQNGTSTLAADFDLFWRAWALLDAKYVNTKSATSTKATDQDRVYGAIAGMVNAMGDPYTSFFPPEEAKAFQEQINGNFEGVGMELGVKEGVLTVIAALKSTPAEKAGIKSGDQILKIDGTITLDMKVDQAVKLIRGKKGTEVKLTIGREGVEPFEIAVVRDVINIPTLDTKYDQSTGIFTIRLYNFTGNSTTLFRNALRDFVATKSNKLIIDLRGNPGGYLEAAVDMASWFLPAGEVVVREDFGPSQAEEVERSSGYNIFGPNLKIVILVDGGSASASEIFAGALSEYGKATLVGTQTFGKGSVQEYMKLDDKTSLKITIARWLTPKGISISDGGLKPQYEVKITPEDAKAGKDPQLDKAIELLK